MPPFPVTRRLTLRILGTGLAAAATAFSLPIAPASATPETARKRLDEILNGRPPQPGRVTLDLPQIAENGNAVPVGVTVDSPMTESDYVTAIHVLAEGNPDPAVISAHLTPLSGQAALATRMRMAKTQLVWAVAEMSDGSVHVDKTEVKVTIGGCGG
jgi:sulfur-oxidizing protein SoxY